MKKFKSPCILYVSSFPPRECGIATFTQDLTNAIDKEFNPEIKSKLIAINDNGTSIYNYPKKVMKQINETDMEDYLNRANEINKSSNIKLVNIQHEYGLFGGEWGDYLLPFLEILKKPIITTFHTVLPSPKEKVKKITRAITEKSDGIVVMTKSSAELLDKVYGADKSKISIIPHGVHNIKFPSKKRAKKKLNLSDRIVLSTFGMLNRDKGIEYAIKALPEIVKEYPNVLYLILGATHPVVRRGEGEEYRNKLKKLIMKLGLKENVKFYNKYLTLEELIEYLKATDIYISPTLNPLQAVSGTISYAMSCACPIIATANQYARDVIDDGRGVLVRFRNHRDIRRALFDFLKDKKHRKEIGKNCYFYSRHMTWQNVALSYFKTFNNIAKIQPREKDRLPTINLNHIRTLTDKFGVIQFASHTKPDIHSGYCVDDNARILFGCAMRYKKDRKKSLLNLIEIYLNFIEFAQSPNGKFCNFVNYNKTHNIKDESEDSFGRAIWAVGYIMASNHIPDDFRKKAKAIFNKAEKWILKIKSLRAIAFSIIGLCYMYEKNHDKKILEFIIRLADKLNKSYSEQVEKDKEKKMAMV
ncbi:MAG: glycosyltransferase family 4 protein [Candidatus Falkowbacteria bacterium]